MIEHPGTTEAALDLVRAALADAGLDAGAAQVRLEAVRSGRLVVALEAAIPSTGRSRRGPQPFSRGAARSDSGGRGAGRRGPRRRRRPAVSRGGGAPALRRIDAAMAVAALTALAALVAEHGFRPAAAVVGALHAVNAICAVLFAGLQAAKLLAVTSAARDLRTHRLDFVLLFLALARSPFTSACARPTEFRYFESRGLLSPLSPLYVGALQAYLAAIVVLRSPLLHQLLVRMKLRPVPILLVSFALMIAVGTALLSLPGASADGRPLGVLDALFTATSAVCVTGLVVRDTGVDFFPIGITVIGLLIQAGGLGIITLTAAFALFGGSGCAERRPGRSPARWTRRASPTSGARSRGS